MQTDHFGNTLMHATKAWGNKHLLTQSFRQTWYHPWPTFTYVPHNQHIQKCSKKSFWCKGWLKDLCLKTPIYKCVQNKTLRSWFMLWNDLLSRLSKSIQMYRNSLVHLLIFQELMRSFQKGIIWPCRLKDCRAASLQSLPCEDGRTIYYVNCVKTRVQGKHSTLNACNFEVFQATRSYNTSLERSNQFLKDREVYKDIALK